VLTSPAGGVSVGILNVARQGCAKAALSRFNKAKEKSPWEDQILVSLV
jgi:hypothetical protein